MNKSYSELCSIGNFDDRLKYLQIFGNVGNETFGFDRIFNQKFYASREWKTVRNQIITRDCGCDLGMSGYEIPTGVQMLIHHINPIDLSDISEASELLLNPENLITVSLDTHNIIHFGIAKSVPKMVTERKPNDTIPWR